MLSNQSILREEDSNQDREPVSVLHLCVSLRANLNFFECVQFRHGYGSKKSFRILKLAQITWSFIEHVRHPFKNKNSVGSNFQKKL